MRIQSTSASRKEQRADEVPAAARPDARVEVTLTRHLSAVAAGKDLFDATHAEYASKVLVATRVPRSVSVQLVARDGT